MSRDTFTYKGYTCKLRKSEYCGTSRTAIEMVYYDEDFKCYMPYGVLTVNLGVTRDDHRVVYLDTNNIPEAGTIITVLGLGKATGIYRNSGYCTYPEYELTEDFEKSEVFLVTVYGR